MSDIKKTALIILIIALLSNTFTQYAYAANDYDHDALMQYEGYGKAMYESIVEQTTFISGQYTDNKDYVSNSIDEIKSYADFWYNEYNDFTSSCYQSSAMNCLGEMVERGGGYALTVGDWIKNLFTGYEQTVNDTEEIHGYASYFTISGTTLTIKDGYRFVVNDYLSRTVFSYNVNSAYNSTNGNYVYVNINYNIAGSGSTQLEKFVTDTEARARELALEAEFLNNPSAILTYLEANGLKFKIYRTNSDVIVDRDINHGDTSITAINNYLMDNSPSVVVPQPKPFLVCPDGTKIQMSISGSTFLAVDGTVMAVSKDGTAEVNGALCNLSWQKPIVDYDPVTKKPVITQPDGTKTDLETGDSQIKPPSVNDLEGCDGVLCAIGKLLDGLGSVVSSITGMVKSLLDGILSLFVPEDLDFMTQEFNKITKKLNDKIAITETLKEAITGVFDGGGSNPLANISINLPITNEPLTFGNVSFIEEGVPILRRVISAIVVLYTIAYVYRKITGRGGVMER